MQVWNLLHAARCKYRTQKSRQKSPSGHHHTTSSGYIFSTKAHIDNRKKNLLSSNTSSTCPYNMVNFRPTIGWDPFVSLAHPCKFQRVSRLGSLTAWHLVVVVSQTCGGEQRAPPMFGRATITLGIGPHSSCYIWLWSRYGIGQTIIFSSCSFFLSSSIFFSSPDLSSHTLDVYHTSTHGVALVRI